MSCTKYDVNSGLQFPLTSYTNLYNRLTIHTKFKAMTNIAFTCQLI